MSSPLSYLDSTSGTASFVEGRMFDSYQSRPPVALSGSFPSDFPCRCHLPLRLKKTSSSTRREQFTDINLDELT